MKSWGRFSVFALVIWAVCEPPMPARGEEEGMPIKDLRLPLDHYEDGTVKTQLCAESAIVPVNGPIVAKNAQLEIFDAEGNVETFVHVAACRYDRERGLVTSKADVRLERKNIVVTGRGLEWRAKKQVVRIMNNAKVVMNRRLLRNHAKIMP